MKVGDKIKVKGETVTVLSIEILYDLLEIRYRGPDGIGTINLPPDDVEHA